MSDELKPCPFCGAHLEKPEYVHFPKSALAQMHPGEIDDGTCPIAGWGFYEEQLETWNTRAQPDAYERGKRDGLERAAEIAKRYCCKVLGDVTDAINGTAEAIVEDIREEQDNG